MQVTLHLAGHLREFYPHLHAPVTLHLERPLSVAEILARAGIPPHLPAAVYLGDTRMEPGEIPPDGASLLILSPIAGG